MKRRYRLLSLSAIALLPSCAIGRWAQPNPIADACPAAGVVVSWDRWQAPQLGAPDVEPCGALHVGPPGDDDLARLRARQRLAADTVPTLD